MPTLPAIARGLLAQVRWRLRRVAPVSYSKLDSIHAHLNAIETRQNEYLMHIRHLAERSEALSARLDVLEANLNGRLDDLAERSETAVALGWDHVALARRLAAIEDRLGVIESSPVVAEPSRAMAG